MNCDEDSASSHLAQDTLGPLWVPHPGIQSRKSELETPGGKLHRTKLNWPVMGKCTWCYIVLDIIIYNYLKHIYNYLNHRKCVVICKYYAIFYQGLQHL